MTMQRILGYTLLFLFNMIIQSSYAENHLVTQKARNFSTPSIKIKVGDTIEFKNDDTVYHNIFSLSDTNTFDLGSFGSPESKKVKFDKAGKVEVECAVHKNMKMLVEVQ
jgi:plastocyanin